MGDIDVSICIATHRQPWRLAQLLDSIARLKQPEDLRAELVRRLGLAAGRVREDVAKRHGVPPV